MISRRDVVAGLIAMPCALEALADPTPDVEKTGRILGPTVFEWEDMKPGKTATGEVRSLCKAPTATVDQLEIHVTALNAVQTSHPPHRHVNEQLIIIRECEGET